MISSKTHCLNTELGFVASAKTELVDGKLVISDIFYTKNEHEAMLLSVIAINTHRKEWEDALGFEKGKGFSYYRHIPKHYVIHSDDGFVYKFTISNGIIIGVEFTPSIQDAQLFDEVYVGEGLSLWEGYFEVKQGQGFAFSPVKLVFS